jgi:hypothetical protein
MATSTVPARGAPASTVQGAGARSGVGLARGAYRVCMDESGSGRRRVPVGQLFISIPAILCGTLILAVELAGDGSTVPVITGIAFVSGGALSLVSALLQARKPGGEQVTAADGSTDEVAAVLLSRAYARTHAGDLDAAARAYDEIIDGPPTSHLRLAVIGRASIALRQQRLNEARTLFARLADDNDPQRAALGRTYSSIIAVATGSATPQDVARLRQAAAAGDPFAGTFQGLLDASLRPRTDPDAD